MPAKKSIFHGKTVVFTGRLVSMTRAEARALVEKAGGMVRSSVSGKTEILVQGDNGGEKVNLLKLKAPDALVLTEGQFARELQGTTQKGRTRKQTVKGTKKATKKELEDIGKNRDAAYAKEECWCAEMEYIDKAQNHNKFYCLWLEGTSVTSKWGHRGTEGRSLTKDFDTEEEAQAWFKKLFRQKSGHIWGEKPYTPLPGKYKVKTTEGEK